MREFWERLIHNPQTTLAGAVIAVTGYLTAHHLGNPEVLSNLHHLGVLWLGASASDAKGGPPA